MALPHALALALSFLAAAPAPGDLRPVVATDAVSLAVGDRHACIAAKDGRLLCWGEGRFSQLGAGLERSARPVAIRGVDDAVEVAAGLTTTCMRRRAGSVDCMGAGYAAMMDRVWDPIVPVPVTVVPAVAWARSIAVGSERAAVATAAGEVWFFATPVAEPFPKPDLVGATQVAVGWENVCARVAGGAVRCFGPNFGGENGNGGDYEDVDWVDVVAPIEPTPEILDGAFHTCGNAVPAVQAACRQKLAGAVDLAMHGRMTCATLATGRVACWGAGPDRAPLALGHRGFSRTPLLVPGLADAVEVTLGYAFACARTRDGEVLCWGANAHGELGRSGPGSAEPRRVEGLGRVVEVAAGDDFACARDDVGAVRCWGNLPGQ